MRVRESSYLILLALAEGPLHGYAVIKAVREISGERVRLGPGTLYGALDRMADEGLVVVASEEVVNGRHRRHYKLTSAGQRVLAEETERLTQLASAARDRLPGFRPAPGMGA